MDAKVAIGTLTLMHATLEREASQLLGDATEHSGEPGRAAALRYMASFAQGKADALALAIEALQKTI